MEALERERAKKVRKTHYQRRGAGNTSKLRIKLALMEDSPRMYIHSHNILFRK